MSRTLPPLPPRADAHAVSIRTVQKLAAYLLDRGHNMLALLGEVGLTASVLFDEDARVPHETVRCLWERSERLTRDPDLGLHVLERAESLMLGPMNQATDHVLFQLFACSATVGEGLARLCRFYGLTHTEAALTMQVANADDVRVVLAVGSGPLPRSLAEYMLGTITRLIRDATLEGVTPIEIRFSHAAPASNAMHAVLFGAPCRFDCSELAFVLRAETLSSPLCTSRPDLIAVFERAANEAIGGATQESAFSGRARALLERELGGGNPSAQHVANVLGVSVRTLSRRLRALGTTHKTLLEDVRRTHAERYLMNEGRSVADTASLLGFADSSAFNRAFKRWFGSGPTTFRGLRRA